MSANSSSPLLSEDPQALSRKPNRNTAFRQRLVPPVHIYLYYAYKHNLSITLLIVGCGAKCRCVLVMEKLLSIECRKFIIKFIIRF